MHDEGLEGHHQTPHGGAPLRQNNMSLGVIGGSGLYELEGLSDVKDVEMDTPFGKPSAPFRTGTLNGQKMVFLARHGPGHLITPHELNYRANLFGLKALGCKWVIASTAVGSLREEIAPGHMVVPDQVSSVAHTHNTPHHTQTDVSSGRPPTQQLTTPSL